MDSTDWFACKIVSAEISSRDRILCSFSPSAFKMWDRAVCCSAMDSNRSEIAWLRGAGAAVVVVVVDVVDVVVVVLVVVLVVVVVLLVVVVVLLVVVVVLLVVVVVLLVVVVVLLVVVVVLLLVVVVLLVVIRQIMGSGNSPINNSLWLSALPANVSNMILPLI